MQENSVFFRQRPFFRDFLCVGILFLLTAVFYVPILSNSGYIWHDFLRQYYPYQVFAARMLARGDFPFWNPYVFSGMPFFADMQAAVLYPFHLVMTFFTGADERLGILVVEYIVVLHVALAGVGMFVALRVWRCSRVGSLTAAIIYMLCGFSVGHIFHVPIIELLPFIPLLLVTIDKCIETCSVVWGVLTAILGCCAVFTGHPQMLTYTAYFISAFAVYRIAALFGAEKNYRLLLSRCAVVVGAGLLTAGLAAVQVLPSVALAEETERQALSYEESSEGSLRPIRFITFFAPNFFGKPNSFQHKHSTYWGNVIDSRDTGHFYWETAGFIGVIGLILAVFAVVYRRSSRIMFFAATACCAVLLAMGDSFFIHWIAWRFAPGIDRFRIPGRWLGIFSVSGSILAGFGAHWLMTSLPVLPQRSWRRCRRGFMIACAVFTVVWLLVASGMFKQPLADRFAGPDAGVSRREQASRAVERVIYPGIVRTVGGTVFMVFCCASLIILVRRRSFQGKSGAVGLFLLVGGDLWLSGFGFAAVQRDSEHVFAPPHLVEPLQRECREDHIRMNARDSKPGSRMIDGIHKVFDKNQGTMHEIFLTEGYNPLKLERTFLTNEPRTFDLLSVKYRTVYDSAAKQPRLVINPTYLKRARMVYDYEIVRGGEQVLSRLHDPSFHYRTRVILEETPRCTIAGERDGKPVSYSCTITRYHPNEVEINVTTSRNGLLVLSDIFYPAWRAEVDGVAANVYRANYALRAVCVPAGSHRVRFFYDSHPFRAGVTCSLISVLMCIGMVMPWLYRRIAENTRLSSTAGVSSQSTNQNQGGSFS